jgi:hypothetical protein
MFYRRKPFRQAQGPELVEGLRKQRIGVEYLRPSDAVVEALVPSACSSGSAFDTNAATTGKCREDGKMKLPPNVQFNEEPELFLWRPRLIVNEAVVNKIIAFIGTKEAMPDKPFNRFSDTTRVDGIDLNFNFIFHVALFRRLSYAGRPPVKSAILVSSLERARYSRMHALLTQGSPLKVKIFLEREAAAKWLGVPLDVLKPK